MNYVTKHSFNGDQAAVFTAIESILLPNGFCLLKSDARALEFKGGGMQSTRENPLRGATHLLFRIRGNKLHLQAQLGGVRFMILFLCLFPFLLGAGLTFLPALTSGQGMAAVNFKVLYSVAAWVVISPLMSIWIRKRTIGSLEDLLSNAILVAERNT